MGTTKWFDRKFDFSFGPESYTSVYQRLKQAPGLLKDTLAYLPEEILVYKPDGAWSIKEHAGHLSILEQIWRIRFRDIHEMKPVLTPADLDNRATTEGAFNGYTVPTLVEKFVEERNATLSFLDSIDALDISRASLHPRLKQPMRIIDLACFVAEHDDHHISVIREISKKRQ